MRFNRNVVGGLALAGVAVVLVAPSLLSRVLPLLVVAACPLSMVFMMRAMGGGRQQSAPRAPVAEAGPEIPEAEAEVEVARLRAELDQLKAERDHVEPPGASHPEGWGDRYESP